MHEELLTEFYKTNTITSKEMYFVCCDEFEKLTETETNNVCVDILLDAIETWDKNNTVFVPLTPIELLASLLMEHELTPQQLADKLEIDINELEDFNLSPTTKQKLSDYFKMLPEAWESHSG